MAVNGPIKGGNFEREILKKLSYWITGDKNDSVLWRTAGSGARATQSLKSKNRQSYQVGDVGAISEKGVWFQSHFVVECKHYKDLELIPFLFKNKGILAGFWEKLVNESNTYSRFPLLISRQNFIPTFIMSEISFMGLEPFIKTPKVYIYWLDDFLNIEYEEFKLLLTSQKLNIKKII